MFWPEGLAKHISDYKNSTQINYFRLQANKLSKIQYDLLRKYLFKKLSKNIGPNLIKINHA
jgi:hypothetical protein